MPLALAPRELRDRVQIVVFAYDNGLVAPAPYGRRGGATAAAIFARPIGGGGACGD